MTLAEKQRQFVQMVGKLIEWAYQQPGYGLTFGEAYRTTQQAAANAKTGIGIADSLHCVRLAIDLNLFIDGTYQTQTEAYRPLGEFWESLGGSWGGRFKSGDGNHFSIAEGGKK